MNQKRLYTSISKSLRFLQVALLILMSVCSFDAFCQTSEAQLIKSYKAEQDPTRKFMRMMVLGEYYADNDIYLADSLQEVIVKKVEIFQIPFDSVPCFLVPELRDCRVIMKHIHGKF